MKQVMSTITCIIRSENHIFRIGRGPLAGPVVAAACFIKSESSTMDRLSNIRIHDSKALNEAEREAAFDIITSLPGIAYGVSIVSHTEIDEINILQASLVAMKRATNQLLEKYNQTNSGSKLSSKAFIALVDGNKIPAEMPVDCEYVIKGDSKVFSIAMASIIAKVTRDRIMLQLDKEYPQYNFAKHKGYPTLEHRTLLITHGPCPVHRVSYTPVRLAIEAQQRKSTIKAAAVVAGEEGNRESRKRKVVDDVTLIVKAITFKPTKAVKTNKTLPRTTTPKEVTSVVDKTTNSRRKKAKVEVVIEEQTKVDTSLRRSTRVRNMTEKK